MKTARCGENDADSTRFVAPAPRLSFPQRRVTSCTARSCSVFVTTTSNPRPYAARCTAGFGRQYYSLTVQHNVQNFNIEDITTGALG